MPKNKPLDLAAKPYTQPAAAHDTKSASPLSSVTLKTPDNSCEVMPESLSLSDIALRSITQGVIITGPDLLIISVNAAFTAITGYSESEVLGRNCKFLTGADTDPLTVAAIRDAIQNAAEFSGLILNYRKNGTPFWNDLTITPVRNAAGILTHFIGVARDATERKQAAKELSESEMRMRLAIHGGDLGLWDWDVVTGSLTVNDRWLSMLGLDPQDRPTIELWHSLVHPEDMPKLEQLFNDVILNPAGCELEVEIRARHQQGNYIWILDKGRVAERASDGSPLRVVGTHMDITARKLAELELSATKNRLQATLDAIPDLLFEIGQSGRMYSYHSHRNDLLAAQPEVFLGKTVQEILPPAAADICMSAIHEAAETGRSAGSVYALQLPQGEIWFEISVTALPDKAESERRFICLCRDVTQRKHAELVDAFLAQASVSANGEAFFPALARFLATTLQMDYVCVDQFDDDVLYATTLTVWLDGAFQENVSYPLMDTPCGVVVEKGKCLYQYNVQQYFPKDLLLQEMQIESYAGIILVSHTGKPIGLIAMLGRKPLANRVLAETALARVATRAAGELERLQAENHIAQTTEILERTGELAKIGGWSVNLKTMKLSWTRETFRIAELEPPLEPSLEQGINLFAPEARPVITAAVQAAIDSGTPYDLEVPIITARGRQRWVHTQGFAELHGGKPVRIYGTFQDITERKQTEQLLLANETKFRSIIHASPVPIAINDEKLRITFLNPAFFKTFGYELSDIPTLSDWWSKAYPDPEYRQWVIDAWQAEKERAAQTNTEFTPLELKIRCKDGTDRFVLGSAAPLIGGLQETHLVLLYDISDRKRAEQDLKFAYETSSRAKNEFLANMSHEIRTPLTAILGFADILSEEETLQRTPEQRKQIVNTIKSAGAHLLSVINDILDLSKIEADKLTIEKAETQLVDVLREVEGLMHQTAASKGLQLTMSITNRLPARIICDATRLRQILMNLVGNAIKFTDQGTVKITAGLEEQDRQARLIIDIADTGPGMTPEQVQGIFKAFGQVDSSVTRRHGGTGLGLVISRRLAKIMGGDVILLSTELGKGSCFRLILPLESITRDAAPASPTPTLSTKPLSGRVLVAEDGLDNQRLVAFMMRKAGAAVETADNGRIALDLLDQAEAAGKPFDLLLTDMQMPEMDGYKLASTLRERGSKLPIIALTAYAMPDDRNKCLDAGCNDFVSKPINQSELIAKCTELLGRNRATTETTRVN